MWIHVVRDSWVDSRTRLSTCIDDAPWLTTSAVLPAPPQQRRFSDGNAGICLARQQQDCAIEGWHSYRLPPSCRPSSETAVHASNSRDGTPTFSYEDLLLLISCDTRRGLDQPTRNMAPACLSIAAQNNFVELAVEENVQLRELQSSWGSVGSSPRCLLGATFHNQSGVQHVIPLCLASPSAGV